MKRCYAATVVDPNGDHRRIYAWFDGSTFRRMGRKGDGLPASKAWELLAAIEGEVGVTVEAFELLADVFPHRT